MLHAYIGEIEFEHSEWIALGEENIVTIQFLKADDIKKYLYAGRKWWVYEGSTALVRVRKNKSPRACLHAPELLPLLVAVSSCSVAEAVVGMQPSFEHSVATTVRKQTTYKSVVL